MTCPLDNVVSAVLRVVARNFLILSIGKSGASDITSRCKVYLSIQGVASGFDFVRFFICAKFKAGFSINSHENVARMITKIIDKNKEL